MKRSRLILSAIFAGFTFCSLATVQAETPEIFTVKKQNIDVTINVSGTVVARKTARLTAQIAGRVEFFSGQEGKRFVRGDELVRIDDSALMAQFDAAVAHRDAALAGIRNANAQLMRELQSPKSDAASSAPGGMGMPSMMDQMFTNPMQNAIGLRNRSSERRTDRIIRETELAQARNSLQRAEAQIRQVQTSLRNARTLAPFDGVIESVKVETGDPVQPGQALLVYSEISNHKVEADVPARIASKLVKGMVLSVRVDGHGEVLDCPISLIFPVADRKQHTIRIEMDLPVGIAVTVGQYAEVAVPDLSSTQISQMTIPRSAVNLRGGLPLVFSLDAENKTRLRIVRMGDELANGQVVLLSGLKEGDRILVDPKPGTRAGMMISLTGGDSAQPATVN